MIAWIFFPKMWCVAALALMRWREHCSWNNGAVVQWRNDLKSGTSRGGANWKKWRAHNTDYFKFQKNPAKQWDGRLLYLAHNMVTVGGAVHSLHNINFKTMESIRRKCNFSKDDICCCLCYLAELPKPGLPHYPLNLAGPAGVLVRQVVDKPETGSTVRNMQTEQHCWNYSYMKHCMAYLLIRDYQYLWKYTRRQ